MIRNAKYKILDQKTSYIIPDVAQLLFKSEVTVRRYIKNNQIKGWYKMGKEWRIEKEDLESFINEVKNKNR